MDSITRRLIRAVRDEEGLGLVEIVVAMFILALIALSLMPLLITGMQASVRNTSIAAATQFANDRIAIAQTLAAGDDACGDLADFGEIVEPMTDARGNVLLATSAVAECPTTVTGTMIVSTSVTRQDTGEVLATATTELLIVVDS